MPQQAGILWGFWNWGPLGLGLTERGLVTKVTMWFAPIPNFYMVAQGFRFNSVPYDLLGMGRSNCAEVLSPTVLVNGLYRKSCA